MNIELERFANIFNLEIVPAEVNGNEALALADIKDTDNIIYGPVDSKQFVDQEMIADYLREQLAGLDCDDVDRLNLWDSELLGEYSDGYWEVLYRMASIISLVQDYDGDPISEIRGAVNDEIMETLGKILDEIAGDLE